MLSSSRCFKTSNPLVARRWCLYLPGVCIHALGSLDGIELELLHKVPDVEIKYKSTSDLNGSNVNMHPAFPTMAQPRNFDVSPPMKSPALDKLTSNNQAFENTSTSVAASQMRNALNNLADTVSDPEEKKVCFGFLNALRNRYLMLSSSSRPRWTTSSLFSADT